MNQIDQLKGLKIININRPPAAIPPPPQKAPTPDAETLLAKKLNAHRDMNKAHAFEYWVAYRHDLNSFDKFSGYNPILHKSILKKWNSFYGESEQEPNFTNLSLAERAYYSNFNSFLGINTKKIFGGIGHAFSWLGNEAKHGVQWVGHEAGHAAGFVAHGAVDIAHDVRNVAEGAAHDIVKSKKFVDNEIHHAGNFIHSEDLRAHKFIGHELGQAAKAVEPYWKIIATVALCAVLVATGVGIPGALAIGSTVLTGLDAIKAPIPPTEIGAGSGGVDAGPTGDGSGFPTDGPGGGDPTNGMSADQQQAIEAQQQQQADEQAAYTIARAKHLKLVLSIVGVAIAGIVVAVIIHRHKSTK